MSDDEVIDNEALFKVLKEWEGNNFLMGASIAAEDEHKRPDGLVGGHAYSLLEVQEEFKMVRLRNPWGHCEWNGHWSDSSADWTEKQEVADALEHHSDQVRDGRFWMSSDDFFEIFTSVCCTPVEMGERAGHKTQKVPNFTEAEDVDELEEGTDDDSGGEAEDDNDANSEAGEEVDD